MILDDFNFHSPVGCVDIFRGPLAVGRRRRLPVRLEALVPLDVGDVEAAVAELEVTPEIFREVGRLSIVKVRRGFQSGVKKILVWSKMKSATVERI